MRAPTSPESGPRARSGLAALLALLTAAVLVAITVTPVPAAAQDPEPATVPSGQLALSGDVSVHDPTLFYDESTDRYVVASTHNSIRSAPTLNGPWTEHGDVPKAEWTFEVSAGTLWAPQVVRVGDTYHYYYSQSSFGSRTSAIGLKTTTTPTDPSSYVDHGEPIIASGAVSDSDDPYDHNAIDPFVLQDAAGDWWITWGSHWDGIMIQRLADDMVTPVGEMTQIADRGVPPNQVEGPAIFLRDGWYYLLTGWDQCCAGADSTYKISVGRSRHIDGPYVDKSGVPLDEGGGTTILDSRVARPGVTPEGLYRAPGGPDVYVEDGVHHLVYHAYRPQNTLAIRPLDWHDGWPFLDEPSGGPYDLSDGAYVRLRSEAAPYTPPDVERVPGREGFGSAVDLNGDSPVGYVEMPDGILADLDGDVTIAAWVDRARLGQTWSRLFDFGSGTGTFLFLSPNAGGGNGGLRLDINAGGESQSVPAGGGGPQLPVGWQHVAVTLSGATGTIWLNGEAYATADGLTLRPADLGETTQNWIGRSQFAADPWLDATVDDVNIFSRALSQDEIGALMTSPGGGDALGGGDVAWYRFDEAGGEVAVDASGQGNDARVVVPLSDDDRLQNPEASDRCLTATDDGDVVQDACDGSRSQVWRIEADVDGAYRFRSSTGLGDTCLTLADASGQVGTDVVVDACDPDRDTDAALQRWYLDDTGHGFHRLVVAAADLALEIANDDGRIATDVVGGARRNTPTANQWPPQQWLFERVSRSADDVVAELDRLVADGGVVGTGDGAATGHGLAAFRRRLGLITDRLDDGHHAAASVRLDRLVEQVHVAGTMSRRHRVTGPDAALLATLLEDLRDAVAERGDPRPVR